MDDTSFPQKSESPGVVAMVLASVFVPGLGQAMQRRIGVALAMFVCIGLSIFVFYASGLWGLFFHIPLMLYASLDVATWAKAETATNIEAYKKNRKSLIIHRVFVPLLCFTLLVALLAPAVHAAREAARRMQCTCHFKGISTALHTYHDAYGSLPPAYTVDAEGKPLHCWRVLLLPYYEQKELYDKIRLDEPWDSEHNRQFHDVEIRPFKCPSAPTANPLFRKFPQMDRSGDCYMSVVVGEQTPFSGSKTVSFDDIRDGTSNTILLVERLIPICWMDPNHEILYETALLGINKDLNGVGSFHSGIALVALCDGSVCSLPEDITPELFKALLTRAGGEKIDDWWDELRR